MKIFLSGLEAETEHIFDEMIREGKRLPFGLVSYFYIRKNPSIFNKIKQCTNEILVDSGAHSFQKGKVVEWDIYTKEYAEWIKENDCKQIIGYFEMDVDNIIGYEKVQTLRKILDEATSKIIPVWHKNRGIEEFKKMCIDTKGDIVAITGFRNEDIQDKDYPLFLKYAWSKNKKIHCLGMTRIKILDAVPFDYVDSSSWKQTGVYGAVKKFDNGKMKTIDVKGLYKTKELSSINFKEFLKLVVHYNKKWAKINKDLCVKWRFVKSRLTKLGGQQLC
ncbi:hypothetical protein EMI88_00200 [Listeria monocytogenes]|nr:hypothetical protein [Listeria monocytogenes]